MHPVTDNNRLAERQSRFRAVPVHEFIYGMTIAALSVRAGKTAENRFGAGTAAAGWERSLARLGAITARSLRQPRPLFVGQQPLPQPLATDRTVEGPERQNDDGG